MYPLATKVEVNRWTKKGKPFNRHKTKEQIKLYRFRSLEMLFYQITLGLPIWYIAIY